MKHRHIREARAPMKNRPPPTDLRGMRNPRTEGWRLFGGNADMPYMRWDGEDWVMFMTEIKTGINEDGFTVRKKHVHKTRR